MIHARTTCISTQLRALPWLALAALLAPGACGEHTTLTSPVVRVDLRINLPPRLQRRISKRDDSHECNRRFVLEAQGARQAFRVFWRVLDDGPARHITAVALEPDGPTSGAENPTASAVVGEAENVGGEGALIQRIPLQVTYEASRGCSKIKASTRLSLRGDAPECRRPRPERKLLTPVD
jgi:hypothetical protein